MASEVSVVVMVVSAGRREFGESERGECGGGYTNFSSSIRNNKAT